LGQTLLENIPGTYETTTALGWFLDKEQKWEDDHEWNTAEFTVWEPNVENNLDRYKWGFADCVGDFTCRITGQGDEGMHSLSYMKIDNPQAYSLLDGELHRRWAEAKTLFNGNAANEK